MSWQLNQGLCVTVDNMLSRMGLISCIGSPQTYKIKEVIIKNNSSYSDCFG